MERVERPKAKTSLTVKSTAMTGYTRPFTMVELEIGIASLKPGKAVGLDNISTEQIRNFGPTTRKWLLQMYNHCLSTNKLPKIWKKAHVLALLKPGKDAAIPKSYRPSLCFVINSSNA